MLSVMNSKPSSASRWSRNSSVFTLFLAFALLPISQAGSNCNFNGSTHVTAFLHPEEADEARYKHLHSPGGFRLVPEPTIILDYHFGPVISGKNDAIKLFVIYYGDFSSKQKDVLRTFLNSFESVRAYRPEPKGKPSLRKWWQITRNYVDLYNTPVARSIVAAGEISYNYFLGKDITQLDIQKVVVKSMKTFGTDARSIYLVLTAEDVLVEKFCMNVCGTHFYTFPSDTTKSQMVPYGWVGNPAVQCPELCSWPYAPGGVLSKGLIPPNGDVGIDGMIITIANLLAGLATNPYGNGFFQPDGLEAAGACQGTYGSHSYPGYPGELQLDRNTGASFNVFGAKNYKFLVPWIWNPVTLRCAGQV